MIGWVIKIFDERRKIVAKDKTSKRTIGGYNLPKLHGHTKITLRDVNTGEVEVHEKDNLVTEAVTKMLFANNQRGAMNYSDLTPLRDMFGGILCFEQALNTSAVLPENDGDNKLVAHAGQTSYSGANPLRGNPNGALSEVIQNGKGYKFVWDFATSQGNGTISAVSLTHKLGGDIGLKPTEAIASNTLFTSSTNKSKALQPIGDTTYPIDFLISVDLTNETGLNVLLSGSTLTVNEVKLCLFKQGINDVLGAADITDTHSVTLTRSFDAQYSAVCTDGTYIYVAQANSNGGSTLQIDKIDMTTWTATAMDITDASLSLAKDYLNSSALRPYGCANRTIVSGGSIYWKKSDKRTFYRINLTNTADIEVLTSSLEVDIDEYDGLNEINDGLLVGKNFIINDDKVYPMTNMNQGFFESTYSVKVLTRWLKSGGKFYVCGYYNDYYNLTKWAAVGFPVVYLATIQNLNTPVTKDNTKTMQIEYSITLDE